MISRHIRVINALGLHARAAAKFVELAGRFDCGIRVTRGARTVDGKSILGLLLLAASRGSELTIETDGADESEALDAICGLIERGFVDA